MKPKNEPTLLPDDPQLTAYALGELEGAERAAVELAVRREPKLGATVAEIRATAARLEAALAGEVVAEDRANKVVPFPAMRRAAGGPVRDPYQREARSGWRALGRFPQVYFVVGGLAAACFALVAAWHTPPAPKPTVAAQERSTNVWLDMSELMAGGAVAPTSGAGSSSGAKPDATAVANNGVQVNRPPTLLEQAKNSELVTAGQLPSPLRVGEAANGEGRVGEPGAGAGDSRPMGVVTAGSAAMPVRSDGGVRLQLATAGGEGRVRTHPADDKFVITAVPARPKPTARPGANTVVGGPGGSGAQAGGTADAVPGTPGLSLLDSTKGNDFATATGAEPSPEVAAGERKLMFLSPFTVSADRFRGRVGASAEAKPETANETPRAAPKVELLPAKPGTFASRSAKTNTEAYAPVADNDFVSAAQNPFSTFSVDADTASYANVRRFLRTGQRPPRDAVRIEELLNYFPYRYAAPSPKSEAPFATSLEVAEAPWAPTHRLVRIGLKGREVTTAERPAANLVFLVDVSGSMDAPNRLPLVKESLRLLLAKLRADDRVAIVTYSGQSGLTLPSTPVVRAREIEAALDTLAAGGATNGAMGIHLAYDIAKANLVTDGINRVILCTDGDFNVGATSERELVQLIQEKAQSGVFLTVLGFGMGNLKDSTLEKLADHGNGNYGYIDSRKEAEKLLVQQVNGTLVPIAKDVKIQVEFNPALVERYRLIGYENRRLTKEDFANDKVDAGEIGAGHTVTAFYEIIPVTRATAAGRLAKDGIESRPYNFYSGVTDNATVPGRINPQGKEMLSVKIRYKKPDAMFSRRLDFPFTDGGGKFANASPDFKFASAVAGFGMILRESPHKGTATMASVIEWAEAGAGDDLGGHRAEFIDLARHADAADK